MTKPNKFRNSLAALALASVAGTAFAQQPVPQIELLTTTEAYDPIRYESAFIIQDAWQQLGFDVIVRPTEFNTLLGLFYDEQNFDAAVVGWSGRVDRLDPQHYLATLDSRQSGLGANNPGGYNNPDYDALFDAQSREFDTEARRELVMQMQELSAPDAPLVVLYHRDEVVAYNSGTFTDYVTMAGEALYNEWTPMEVTPVGGSTALRIGSPQEPDNLNPVSSTSVWGWKWMRMYYDKLVRLSPDIEPIPWMAESIEAVDDVTVDVVLRPGQLWHDGEAVTAEDVKFTYDYYQVQDYAYFNAFLASIESVEVTGDLAVRFHLSEPFAPLVTVTFSQIPILPEHIWSGIEDASALTPANTPTVGSGPFVYDRYDRGEFMRLVRNDNHFHADEIAIDAIEMIIYADAEGVFTGLQTGEIDFSAWRLEPGQIPLAESSDSLTVVSVPDFGYYHMTWNLRRAPFDDVATRRALAHAVDQERMVNVLLDGRAEVGSSVVAPVNAFWHNPFVERFEYDLDLARELLAEAGFSWDAEGNILK